MTTLTDFPLWIEDLRARRPNETARQHVVRIARGCEGLNLHEHAGKLADLFLATEGEHDRAAIVAAFKTNCATFVIAVLVLAGCVHPVMIEHIRNGAAFTELRDAAHDLGASRPGHEWRDLQPGTIILYWQTGNDAHAEVLLSAPDASGVAEHGGGGRPDNAITIDRGSILCSWNRPIQETIDPELMCVLPARGDDPY